MGNRLGKGKTAAADLPARPDGYPRTLHELPPDARATVAAWLRRAAAALAPGDLAAASYRVEPVPGLVLRVVHLSGARRVAGVAADEAALILQLAPLNVAALSVPQVATEWLPHLIAVLADHPHHRQLRALELGAFVTDEQGRALSDALAGDPPTLRRLQLLGDGALAVAAGRPVATLGAQFGAYAHHVTAVTLPPTLRRIGPAAFQDCMALASLDLAATRVRVLPSSFARNCVMQLAVVRLPETLEVIGDDVLSHCGRLTALDLSHTAVRRVGGNFLRECFELSDVRFPPTLEALGAGALRQCYRLPRVDLAATRLAVLDDGFAESCSELADVRLPPALREIRHRCFNNCDDLAALDLSRTAVARIGRKFCYCCLDLAAVQFPPALRRIGDDTVEGRDGVAIPAGVHLDVPRPDEMMYPMPDDGGELRAVAHMLLS
jgi:hypothetical protein